MPPVFPPASLVLQREGAQGPIHLLEKPVTVIGRAEDNDIVIDDARASRRHAHVRREDYRFVLEDLGSTNGTWVNGQRLSAPHQLANNDRVQIAGHVFRFVDPSTTVASAQFQALVLDDRTGEVRLGGAPLQLSAKEYALLRLLYDHAGELVTKQAIADTVWPEYAGDVADYNIEGLVSRLRAKLEPDPDNPVFLITMRGMGYRLSPTRQIE
jgi:pSer/pThr/pTyr-binding forkhead associated (FHA) protein